MRWTKRNSPEAEEGMTTYKNVLLASFSLLGRKLLLFFSFFNCFHRNFLFFDNYFYFFFFLIVFIVIFFFFLPIYFLVRGSRRSLRSLCVLSKDQLCVTCCFERATKCCSIFDKLW